MSARNSKTHLKLYFELSLALSLQKDFKILFPDLMNLIESFDSLVCYFEEPRKKQLLNVAAINSEEHFCCHL